MRVIVQAEALQRSEDHHYHHFIHELPTIDAEPVQHGRWGTAEIIGYDGYHAVYAYPCSKCGKYTREHKPNYCPHCGAKMDEKAKTE